MLRSMIFALLSLIPLLSFAGGVPELFLPDDPTSGRLLSQGASAASISLPQGFREVRINPELAQSIQPGQRVSLGAITGSPREVVFERIQKNERGARVWIGEVAGMGSNFRVVMVQDEQATVGRILTPEGEFLLQSENGRNVIVDVKAAGLKPPANFCGAASLKHQERLESAHPRTATQTGSEAGGAATPASASSLASVAAQSSPAAAGTTIDVLVVINNDLATELGAGLQARIDLLFALSNQAYIDSGADLQIRRVGAITQINYTSLNDNGVALDAITDGVAPFNTIANLRNTSGADLVVLLRPFEYPEQVSCGVAWVSGYNQQPIAGNINFWSQLGYAVVSNGSDPSGYYCTDMTFPHELGHNMGLAHDRANGGGDGAYTYANGYGIDGVFGTIMSYLSPEVAVFSNPNKTCTGGNPCGINENAADSAHAALALNNTKTSIAAYRAEAVVTASCGTSNAVPSVTTPTNLCSSGTASSVTSTSSLYSWSCTGSNTVQCSAPRHYSLTTSTSGGGSISVTPNQSSYAYNSSVNLTATPNSGKVFSAWSGDCSGSSTTCTLAMTSNRTVSASFTDLPVNGSCGASNGVATVAIPANLCSSGTASSVTSTSSLYSWSCTGSNTVQCSAPRHYSLTTSTSGGGSISINPNQSSYAYNASVTLTAQADSGKVFSSWSGDCAGSSSTCALSMNASKSVAASFITPVANPGCGSATNVPSVTAPTQQLCSIGTPSSVTSTASLYSWNCVSGTTVACSAPRHYSLTSSISGAGSVTRSPNQSSYAYNASVTLTAKPDSGVVMGAWGGDCVGTASVCMLQMSSNRTFNVSFVAPTENHFSRLYLAAFLRAADLGGMNYWSNQITSEGQSYQKVGGTIFSLPIVTDIYPAGMSDPAFVEAIYNNVFGRASDIEGLNYWTNELATLRNTYMAQGSVNAAYEARGQLVMNMINAGLGTVEGTPGKMYIDNRFQVSLYASERQRVLGKEIPPATLRNISDQVNADKATVVSAKDAIDLALNL